MSHYDKSSNRTYGEHPKSFRLDGDNELYFIGSEVIYIYLYYKFNY